MQSETAQTQESLGESRLHEIKVAYERPLLVQSKSLDDASMAAFLAVGRIKKFSSEERKAYVNIYNEAGEVLSTVSLPEWVEAGEAFVKGVNEYCQGLAGEQGFEPGTPAWGEFVKQQTVEQYKSCGFVA